MFYLKVIMVLTCVCSVWSSSGVLQSDIDECKEDLFRSVICRSANRFYRECMVPGATEIHLIKLHENLTSTYCGFRETFGFRENVVWVNQGCSGNFYICYIGEPLATPYPIDPTVKSTQKPPGTTPKPNIIIREASLGPASDNTLIYIIVGVVLIVLVGIGLLVGCIVKRRQQRDKSRHLAEKRQSKLEQKRQQAAIEEFEPTTFPLATKSLSMESIRNLNNVINYRQTSNDAEGSDCSSRSSLSGFTSVSGLTSVSANAAGFPRSRLSLALETPTELQGQMRRGCSISDIRTIGRIQNEKKVLMLKQKNISHTSLESIREVGLKYNMYDIPIEKKLKEKYRRPAKYNTVGSTGAQTDSIISSASASLPLNKTKVHALVHAPAQTQHTEQKRVSIVDRHDVTMGGSIYHDPQSMLSKAAYNQGGSSSYHQGGSATHRQYGSGLYSQGGSASNRHYGSASYSNGGRASNRDYGSASYRQGGSTAYSQAESASYNHSGSAFRPIKPAVNAAGQQTVGGASRGHSGTVQTGQQNNAIYATIRRGCLKPSPSNDSDSGIMNVSFNVDDELPPTCLTSHSDIYSGKPFSYFGTFKPPPGHRYYAEEANVSNI